MSCPVHRPVISKGEGGGELSVEKELGLGVLVGVFDVGMVIDWDECAGR